MRKGKTKGAESPLAVYLKSKALQLQRGFALKMERLTARLSLREQKWAALFFCMAGGVYCTLLIVSGLTKNTLTRLAPVGAISRPVSIEDTLSLRSGTDKGREKVQELRYYMDSLRASEQGSLRYDSIRHFRPGLLDTLDILETYYQLN